MVERAPIILTALMGAEDFAQLDRLRQQHFPVERNFLPAHITLFHHLPPGCEGELRELLKTCSALPPPSAWLSEVMQLGRGVAYRMESPDLLKLREEIADRLHGMLVPQDQATPRLHVTVQNKVEPAAAKRLFRELVAGFEPRPLKIVGLALWFYRGGPWEPVKQVAFRGR